jgi:integrase/recombinase XerD
MIKPKVVLSRIAHRDIDVVKICFEKDEEIIRLLRTLSSLRWSQTHRAWYIPYTESIKGEIFKLLSNVAYIDYGGLNTKSGNTNPRQDLDTVNKKPAANIKLSAESEEKIKSFISWMQSRRYSENTIGTYTDALKTFLKFYATKSVSEITNTDLIVFNNVYILKNKLSTSFQNQVVNSIKLFFKTVEMKVIETDAIHRPMREHKLPNVLSKEEIKIILNAHGNIKHKAMLSLIYSCGLRRGELLSLKLEDIDSNRGLIKIKQGKGKKDRVVPLSEKVLILLRDYYVAYKPKNWLFEGQNRIEPYDENSLRAVLKQALEKSKITKPVTLHWLRHSYATHLLENGTDLRYIQEILGHSRSTTTEIYTHVSTKSIQKIVSPFDSL